MTTNNQSANAPTIAEIVATSGLAFDHDRDNFNILFNALEATGLTAALDDPTSDLTVFAPTDRAFLRLASDLGFGGGSEADAFQFIAGALGELGGSPEAGVAILTDVLLYHVSAGAKDGADVRAADSVDTLLGETIEPQGAYLADKDPDIADARLAGVTIEAAGGTVLPISRVLLPVDLPGGGDHPAPEPEPVPVAPTIAGLVAQSGGVFDHDRGDFDILLNAVQAAGLVGALDDPTSDLTVFAPTDQAFLRLARDLGYRGSDEGEAFGAIADALEGLGGSPEAGLALLTDVLLFHVAPGERTTDEILDEDAILTLQGGSLTPQGRYLADADPDIADARVIGEAIDLSGGSVQAISRVLLPVDLPTGYDHA